MHIQQIHTPLQEAHPLVSFVITYYDLPIQMLCRAIDSILSLPLTADEREIIVVDDGSPTSPMNGLMHYGDDIVYIRQKNGGLSAARNKGIEAATGRFLQFVDADDYLLTAPYRHCLSLLTQHEEADMVVFDFTTDRDGQEADSYPPPRLMSGTAYMRHHNIRGTACGYLLSRAILGELRFTPGIYHEDEEFTPLLLVRAEHVVVSTCRAYFYNHRPYSITTDTDDDSTRKRLDDCHGVILSLSRHADRMPHEDRLALLRRVAQLTMDYIYQTVLQTRSAQQLEERIAQLRSEGLFPLPAQNYSAKYVWFRRLSATPLGRKLLLRTLPLLRKER